MSFYSLDELPSATPSHGVLRRSVYLEGLMLTFFDFESGAVVPTHSHPHEQITYVIDGALEFTLADETRVLHAGEGVAIPAGVSHSAIARQAGRVVDGWHPIREDYT